MAPATLILGLLTICHKVSPISAGCGSIFLPDQHHALIGHSFLGQTGTGRIQCMMLCWRHSRCLSFNHDDTNGTCQLNNARKEEFPESYKQDEHLSYFGSSKKGHEDKAATTTAAATTTTTIAAVTLKVCNSPLGMESGAIADSQIKASSVKNNDHANYGTALARLNSESAWCANTAVKPRWIQADMGSVKDLRAIIVQGRPGQYVFTFTLSKSGNGAQWTHLLDGNGYKKRYYARESYKIRQRVSVETAPSAGIRSRYIRITAISFTTNYLCMRFELIGCD
ncbi:lactadherin-like [Asterias rubens]|uniref:lactadherin-like n=1 Tax=Asterias rubens TaxID=7604 RepID=UPI00145589FB|nr:lactadherin-like [Asterias rubens]